jgi:hypothetical protein
MLQALERDVDELELATVEEGEQMVMEKDMVEKI